MYFKALPLISYPWSRFGFVQVYLVHCTYRASKNVNSQNPPFPHPTHHPPYLFKFIGVLGQLFHVAALPSHACAISIHESAIIILGNVRGEPSLCSTLHRNIDVQHVHDDKQSGKLLQYKLVKVHVKWMSQHFYNSLFLTCRQCVSAKLWHCTFNMDNYYAEQHCGFRAVPQTKWLWFLMIDLTVCMYV